MIKHLENYEQNIKHTVTQAVNHIQKGDVMALFSSSQAVSFEYDKLSSVDDTSYSSLLCRVFEEGKVGNSYVNNPQLWSKMIDNAKESSRFGERVNISLPFDNNYNDISWLYQERNLHYTKQDLQDIALDLLHKIKKISPNAKVSTYSQNDYASTHLSNTAGFQGCYRESSLYVQGGLFSIATDGSFLEMYEGVAFYDQEVDLIEILIPLQEQWERCQKVSTMTKTGKLPVIFAPSVMDLLMDPLGISGNGKTLAKGLSFFENSMGEQIFSELFSVVDDPYYKYGLSTAPFDDEGVIGKKLSIINNGIFENFIHDSTTASKLNVHTTGHASRGVQSLPEPAFTNRVVGLGAHTLKEMIASVDYGLFLETVLGEGQSNVLAGDFSVLADTAYLIENGELKGRVKDLMVSGNAFELLKHVLMIENKIHKESMLFVPHILIDQVQVSYK